MPINLESLDELVVDDGALTTLCAEPSTALENGICLIRTKDPANSVTALALGLTYRPTKTVAAKLEYQNVKSGSAIAPRADSSMLGAGFSF